MMTMAADVHDRSMRERFLPEKLCKVCGRRFAWRRKWERDWESVAHCSNQCRRRGLSKLDAVLEEAILDLTRERATSGATICPSEVARFVRPDDWRPLMEPVRMAARRLSAREFVEFRQRGRVVDPTTAKGAVRLAAVR